MNIIFRKICVSVSIRNHEATEHSNHPVKAVRTHYNFPLIRLHDSLNTAYSESLYANPSTGYRVERKWNKFQKQFWGTTTLPTLRCWSALRHQKIRTANCWDWLWSFQSTLAVVSAGKSQPCVYVYPLYHPFEYVKDLYLRCAGQMHSLDKATVHEDSSLLGCYVPYTSGKRREMCVQSSVYWRMEGRTVVRLNSQLVYKMLRNIPLRYKWKVKLCVNVLQLLNYVKNKRKMLLLFRFYITIFL